MGQAFRRASGRIRATSSSDATSSKNLVDRNPSKNSVAMEEASNQKPTKTTVAAEEASKIEQLGDSMDSDGTSGRNTQNDLEERDPQYDAMLNLMVGRIRTKPGGKPEMGEASVVEKYRRPLPKLRNTKPNLNIYEEMATPAGTLNVAQLRQIILLHEGKSEDHDGPMEVRQIAQRFRVEAEEVQRILQFVSLPQESDNKD